MSSPGKKRKRTKKPSPAQVVQPTPQSTPNPSLPDDLLLNCFACLSRLYYPTLSLVSKRFPSLVASPELYKTRSSLGHTESCLYVCLDFYPDHIPYVYPHPIRYVYPHPISRWFTLCRKPDKTLTTNDTKKKKPTGYVLAKLTTLHSRSAHWSSLVTIGSDIYNIGGPINNDNDPSSSVSILDCRSHTWREGPSMLVKRKYPFVNVLDGKIYVLGGDSNSSSSDSMEVFDPKTQTWELVSSPSGDIRVRYGIRRSTWIDKNVYFFGIYDVLAYKTSEDQWENVGMEMSMGLVCYSYCVIENVLYYYNDEGFKWYDATTRLWRVLKGMKGLPKFPRYCVTLADYGGKMAVLWERVVASSGYKDKMIWCAVIALERRNSEEIWGKVEWQDTVLTVPKKCSIKYALAATL